ncbi:MAG TPA: sigma-70 family RNA polymerase sigma factor [Planctomycetaceae bacterium]|nr:sigma-70 family RNA polymerase sigma factor [Planctomycetaceae bacterium]
MCSIYWLPVYAFMRRQTANVHTAQDWTQGFFASLLSREAFDQVDPSRGRLRSFLLAAARHFVSNERDRERAQIRGGQNVIQSLNFEQAERILSNDLAREPSAESLFERQWALAVLSRTMDRLRGEHDAPDKRQFFDSVAGHLSGAETESSLQEVAALLHMSPESVRVGLHRLRKRYRRILREEIAQTTLSPDQFDDEIRQLFNALSLT